MKINGHELQLFLDSIYRELIDKNAPKSLSSSANAIFKAASSARATPWLAKEVLKNLLINFAESLDKLVKDHQELHELEPPSIELTANEIRNAADRAEEKHPGIPFRLRHLIEELGFKDE